MLKLYDFFESGNCYKVRWLLSALDIPFTCIPVDILKAETRTDNFLKLNPNHRVPVLEWPDGRTLAESNAILFYLAEGTPLLPADPWQRAQILQWLFFEQYSHEPYIAVVRFWHFSGTADEHADELEGRMARGYEALGVMDAHLTGRDYFVGANISIADLALFAYTHVAPEGGFDLQPYPAVCAWIERIEQRPDHLKITEPAGQ